MHYSINKIKYIFLKLFSLLFFLICFSNCRKLIEIPAPYNAIVTSQVFADSADAMAALAGLYSVMINAGGDLQFSDGATTVYLGLSADELAPFDRNDPNLQQFYNNTLQTTNGSVNAYWSNLYPLIYRTNALIEGIQSSKALSKSVKDQIEGESKFFRAFYYFYLVNVFGDVPLITNTDYKTNQLAARTSKSDVYQQILTDLKDAQNLLPTDYSASGGEKTRVNKLGVTAFLARVYLYLGNWKDAETASSDIINSNIFSLPTDLNEVFLANSTEAILQLSISSDLSNGTYNATPEGVNFVKLTPTPPVYYISPALMNSFEDGDQRKVAWIDSTVYESTAYYYPYKYKIGYDAAVPNDPVTEYYMVLRLAEQYLIRAEARAQQNIELPGAIEDINMVHERAGLVALPTSLTQSEILQEVVKERRIELFLEWGHRWLDLKRTATADATLQPIKSFWQSYQQLYPIPFNEITFDPNLRQNPGYH